MSKIFTEHHGYDLFECISALQKDIRRGNEKEAMYWAMELIPKYEGYLWRRLVVIVNEDIGLGKPELLAIIPALRDQFFEFRSRNKDGTCRLILANSILLMSRAPKSRLADEFQRVSSQAFIQGEKLPIPDYALDNHTRAGKRLGRGVDFWLEHGCLLANPAALDNPYKNEAERLWAEGKTDAPVWGNAKSKKKAKSSSPQKTLFDAK